ncbi:MAG: N-acyl-D-amino-acid deacylase [Gemmatimonadetes bacterium]|nr:N-acyl-D-amino-acid deacylase [Gemmatimonadota bacterium]
MVYDYIIDNGTIVDGNLTPKYRADLGIKGSKITDIGDLKTSQTKHRIDAKGLTLAPGFIDVHNHSDGWLRKTPNFLPKTSQGFTTEVLMADGISYAPVDNTTWRHWMYYMRALNGLQQNDYDGWESIEDYMNGLDGTTCQNTITHFPYAHARTMAMGWIRSVPDDVQMEEIQTSIIRGMEEGAVGVSTGLDYISECFAQTDEIIEACKVISPYNGLYVTHIRYKKGTLSGIKEAVEIGKRSNVSVHISHLKGTSNQQIDEILNYIDQVAINEVNFSFDVYPYLPGSTMLNYMLPYEVWEEGPLCVLSKLNNPEIRERFARIIDRYEVNLDHIYIAWLPSVENAQYIGRSLGDYVKENGKEPADALSDLLIDENLAVLLVFHHGDDELVHPFLSHPSYMMGTDGIYFPNGAVHPRMYGSAGRLLGPCVRDHKLFNLETAVHKLSGLPAQRFGIKDRGFIKEGYQADIVAFDARAVKDQATYKNPHQFCFGINHVLVNGTVIIKDGQEVDLKTETYPGKALRYNKK